MPNSLTERTGLATYLAVAFAVSILLSLATGLTGGHDGPVAKFGLLSMLAPALGVVAARLIDGERLGVTWRGPFPYRWLPVALFALPLLIHVVVLPGILLLEGHLPWLPWLTPEADGLYHTSAKQGWGTITGSALARRFAINALVGVIVVSIFSFFEEVGWRAFMLPRLAQRLGLRRAALAGAGIWALWHVPFALSGVQHVDHVSPLAVALINPLGHIGAGLFLALLWFRTRSLVLTSLAHGSLNNWGQYAFKYMDTPGAHDIYLLLMVNLALLLAGALAWSRLPREEATTANDLLRR